MPKRISAAERRRPVARRHRDAGQPPGGRGRTRAATLLAARAARPTLRLHAAAEWSDDPAALERCRADIARGDIVIADHAVPGRPHPRGAAGAAGAPRAVRRDGRPACRRGEVMKLTRIGRFRMDGRSERRDGAAEAAARRPRSRAGAPAREQMRCCAGCRKILRFIPGTAQDVRAYFLTLQYWLAGSDENVADMVRFLVDRYADGPRARPARRAQGRAAGRVSRGRALSSAPARPRSASASRRCRGAGGDARHGRAAADALLRAGRQHRPLRRRDRRAGGHGPAGGPGLRQRPRLRARRSSSSSCGTAGPRSTRWSRSPASRWSAAPPTTMRKAAEEMLARLDVPYLAAQPVEFQTLEQWERSTRGLLPVEATMMVAIPELDGATGRWSSAAAPAQAAGAAGAHDMQPPPRARRHAGRARGASWSPCAAPQRAERKVAIVLFNFPPNAGTTGTAAYLVGVRVAAQHADGAGRAPATRSMCPATSTRCASGHRAATPRASAPMPTSHARIPADDHVRRER